MTTEADSVIERLFNSTTADGVESVFAQFQIADPSEKTDHLHRCMQVQNIYAMYGDTPPTDEETYHEELAFFLDGQWRDLI